MASSYHVQVTFSHDTGLPKDAVVNNWSCQTVNTDDLTALQDFVDALQTFYLAIDQLYSTLLSGNVSVKCYDRSDSEPRVPVLTDSFTITPASDALPSEVALCLSFQGVAVSGTPQSRRRGRVYLGPWAVTMLTGSNGRPNSTHIATIDAAATNLLAESGVTNGWFWTVWSEVNGTDTEVDNGWIDNSFDTIRGRGEAATSRSLF
jgi:hypothetical protein